MGCDIHMCVEVFGYEDEDENGMIRPAKWELAMSQWATFRRRNYYLFEILAGVRGEDDKAISPPRGKPKDLTRHVANAIERDGADGHSHSWLLLSELINYPWPEHCREFKVWLDSLCKFTRAGYRDPTQVRLVFWFDN